MYAPWRVLVSTHAAPFCLFYSSPMTFLCRPDRRAFTVVKPACNKSIDEALCISLREKRTHLGNVPQVVKSYFGHIPNV